MSTENPRTKKWRYTWEAQSHIPTLKLLLFNPAINPKSHCTNLHFHLNPDNSILHVSWPDNSLRVPVPRVLVDVDSPLSFKSMEDHIEVKISLLVSVDHPIVSNNFDCEENVLFDGLESLVVDSDLKILSSKEGVHFYCRNCSTKLTKNPIRNFVEMPSADWREVADNWFGSCCCSFGGISEKLVTKYANSYEFCEGACLLNMMFIVLYKDDLVGCKFPDLDGYQQYNNGIVETRPGSENNLVKKIWCKDEIKEVHDVDEKLSFISLEKENLLANLNCELKERETNAESLECELSLLDISEDNCFHGACQTSAIAQDGVKCMKLLEHQKSFLNGFLGNLFMVRSPNLSKDVDWVNFECSHCSSVLGAYPCKNGYGPIDGGVRLFKCYISTFLPGDRSEDMFRRYNLESMFTSQLLENAKEEISFRTVVRDMKSKFPDLQVVLLNPHSWCCTGSCDDNMKPVSKIDLIPVLKLLFLDCSNNNESQLRNVENWVIKTQAEEVYMLAQQIKDLTGCLESAKDAFPPSCAFMQGLPLSFLQR